ncbi:hypothetical protein OROGR_023657 [Orobanche gracilis]
MDSYLRPLEETKQILKQSIISYLGNLTDEEMVPTDAERKAFRQTSPLKEKYTLGMCKLLMYLLNLQYGACRDPNNLTSSEDAVVTEIQLMESKLRHQIPNHMRKKKFEDIDLTNLHPGLAKCFFESLLELESALQNKYNENKAEEERIKATAAKNRLKKQRRRDRKLQASAEPETQVKADDGLDKKDVVTKQTSTSMLTNSKTCYCNKDSPLRIARTEANRGQKFYGCVNYGVKGEQVCRFFEWADEEGVASSKLGFEMHRETLLEDRINELKDKVLGLRTAIEIERNLKTRV